MAHILPAQFIAVYVNAHSDRADPLRWQDLMPFPMEESAEVAKAHATAIDKWNTMATFYRLKAKAESKP